MNDYINTISLYEEVAKITSNMLSAAHQNDWDKLTELENGCANCVEKLQGYAMAESLNSADRCRKIALLKTILANDRQIRQLTEPWIHRIGELLGSDTR